MPIIVGIEIRKKICAHIPFVTEGNENIATTASMVFNIFADLSEMIATHPVLYNYNKQGQDC